MEKRIEVKLMICQQSTNTVACLEVGACFSPLLEEFPHKAYPQQAFSSSHTPVQQKYIVIKAPFNHSHFPTTLYRTCSKKKNLCQTFVSSRSSRMSPCPAPLMILCRSLATSSSSSPIGLSLGRRALHSHQEQIVN